MSNANRKKVTKVTVELEDGTKIVFEPSKVAKVFQGEKSVGEKGEKGLPDALIFTTKGANILKTFYRQQRNKNEAREKKVDEWMKTIGKENKGGQSPGDDGEPAGEEGSEILFGFLSKERNCDTVPFP